MVETVHQEENPIREADKESIDRLFSKDPQFLTAEDIDMMVEKLRAGRGKWIHETEKRATAKKPKKLSSVEAKQILSSLQLKF